MFLFCLSLLPLGLSVTKYSIWKAWFLVGENTSEDTWFELESFFFMYNHKNGKFIYITGRKSHRMEQNWLVIVDRCDATRMISDRGLDCRARERFWMSARRLKDRKCPDGSSFLLQPFVWVLDQGYRHSPIVLHHWAGAAQVSCIF